MTLLSLKKTFESRPMGQQYLFLVGILFCYFNIYLSTIFVFGSLFLNPMVLLVNGKLLTRTLQSTKPIYMIISLLAIIIINDVGVSTLYEAPHTAEMDLWIKVSQLLTILPLFGMARKQIALNTKSAKGEKNFSLTLLSLGIVGYYAAGLGLLM